MLWGVQSLFLAEGVRLGGLKIPSLLFSDDVVLLVSLNRDLQLALAQFAAELD